MYPVCVFPDKRGVLNALVNFVLRTQMTIVMNFATDKWVKINIEKNIINPYNRMYIITQTCINGAVTLHLVLTTEMNNICHIDPYN